MKATAKHSFRWLSGHARVSVILVLVTAVGVWGFAEVAGEVTEGESHQFDRFLLLSLREPSDSTNPIGPPWLEDMARDITALGSLVVLAGLTLASAGFLWLTKRGSIAIFLIATTVTGALVSSALKLGFDRPRPDLVPHSALTFTKSFPSGHSAMSALVFLTLGAFLARTQPSRFVKSYLLASACFLTILVGTSRVYLGVHWPTDVVAGWAFGVAWAAASWLAFGMHEKRIERAGRSGSIPKPTSAP